MRLLPNYRELSTFVSGGAFLLATGSGSCLDAIEGNEPCYSNALWTKETGIRQKPEWYARWPFLTASSKLADFQYILYRNMAIGENGWDCPVPCSASAAMREAMETDHAFRCLPHVTAMQAELEVCSQVASNENACGLCVASFDTKVTTCSGPYLGDFLRHAIAKAHEAGMEKCSCLELPTSSETLLKACLIQAEAQNSVEECYGCARQYAEKAKVCDVAAESETLISTSKATCQHMECVGRNLTAIFQKLNDCTKETIDVGGGKVICLACVQSYKSSVEGCEQEPDFQSSALAEQNCVKSVCDPLRSQAGTALTTCVEEVVAGGDRAACTTCVSRYTAIISDCWDAASEELIRTQTGRCGSVAVVAARSATVAIPPPYQSLPAATVQSDAAGIKSGDPLARSVNSGDSSGAWPAGKLVLIGLSVLLVGFIIFEICQKCAAMCAESKKRAITPKAEVVALWSFVDVPPGAGHSIHSMGLPSVPLVQGSAFEGPLQTALPSPVAPSFRPTRVVPAQGSLLATYNPVLLFDGRKSGEKLQASPFPRF